MLNHKVDSSHWYFKDGEPAYEIPKKDGSGMKVPTLADARKLGLLPSVTTILKVLHKEGLVKWRIEQACMAILTSPKFTEETLDAFVDRVLNQEQQHEEEGQKARDRGTEIHAGIENYLLTGDVTDELKPWVCPPADAIRALGKPVAIEKVLVGDGYAGKCDLILDEGDGESLWDWKTTKKLPKAAWDEHKLQLSAYAVARMTATAGIIVGCGNVYISTLEPGKFVICRHVEPIRETFHNGFEPIMQYWQWANGYKP